MPMTKAGGGNLRKTMERKFGSYEAWKAYLKEIASKGGKAGTGHKFGHGKVDPVEAGKKAGKVSRRRWTPELRQEMSDKMKQLRARERQQSEANAATSSD